MASVKFKKALTKAAYTELQTKDENTLYFLEGATSNPSASDVRLMLGNKDYTGVKKIETGSTAGTIKVDGTDVAVNGAVTNISGKADKVTGATNGNFAGLDSNGNLTDSGSKAADFATAAQGTTADSAVQSVKVGSEGSELKSGTNVVLPTSYPAADKVGHKLTVGEKEFDGSASVTIAKADLGLSNVDNTSDATKKSNFTGSIADGNTGFVTGGAAYTALAGKIDSTEKGTNNGVATLGADGKVPSTQLPSYVDDVIEGYFYNDKFYEEAAHTTEITGEGGKIYVDLTGGANKSYRYSGSAFVEIVASPGTTDNITEGSTNLYYTNARADARVAAGIAALDAEETSTDGTNVQVKVTEVDGKITAVNITTDNTATATDITNAIAALDATKSQTAGADGLALSITETDGKITAISGSIAANTYDAHGAAAAVLGTSSDTKVSNTVYGAKAYAASLLEWDAD